MPDLLRNTVKEILLGEKVMSLFDGLDWYSSDTRPASTLITNLWILTQAGAIPWHRVRRENHHSIYRKGHDRFGIINKIVGEIAANLSNIIFTIYMTTKKNGDIEYLLTFKLSSYEQVTKHVFETKDHHNVKLQDIYRSLDSGFFGIVRLPDLKIDQARYRALVTIKDMN